jgi:hypothetical protein
MTHYLIDANLGSAKKMGEIYKFLKHTRENPEVFLLVYGGKNYKEELSKITSLSKYILELRKTNQALEIPEDQVNQMQEYYETYTSNKYDDPHIFAIVSESYCKIIATQDMYICEFYDKKSDLVKKNKPDFFYKNDTLFESFKKKFK